MWRKSDNLWNRSFFRNGLACVLLLWLGWIPVLAAHSVTLAWDPSPDTNAAAYKVYYGGASRNYTNSQNVDNTTTATISGLTDGATYYFSATALATDGEESQFSNEATCVIPQTNTNPPAVSQPPTLDAIANLTLYQNAGPQTVALTGISAGSGGNATVNISAVSSDTTIIPTPTLNYSNSNSTGTLTVAPATNAVGTATVTVTVNNGATSNNLASQQFTVTVLPAPAVSHPPTLNAITNLTLYQNAGLQTVALTGITAGSGGNPTVTISAVSSDTTIIPTPILNYTNSSSTGTLTFAPVTNAVGTATVTVTVNNGATSNNLAGQQFTITVLPVPTLNALTNLTIYQNAGAQTVPLTGITSGSTNQNLTISVWAYTSDSTEALAEELEPT